LLERQQPLDLPIRAEGIGDKEAPKGDHGDKRKENDELEKATKAKISHVCCPVSLRSSLCAEAYWLRLNSRLAFDGQISSRTRICTRADGH
jgi:hypothetical protein